MAPVSWRVWASMTRSTPPLIVTIRRPSVLTRSGSSTPGVAVFVPEYEPGAPAPTWPKAPEPALPWLAPAALGADEPASEPPTDVPAPACGAVAVGWFDPAVALRARDESALNALAAAARRFRSASPQLSKRTRATSAARGVCVPRP